LAREVKNQGDLIPARHHREHFDQRGAPFSFLLDPDRVAFPTGDRFYPLSILELPRVRLAVEIEEAEELVAFAD